MLPLISLSNCIALGAVNRSRDTKCGGPVPGMPVNVTEEANKQFHVPPYNFQPNRTLLDAI